LDLNPFGLEVFESVITTEFARVERTFCGIGIYRFHRTYSDYSLMVISAICATDGYQSGQYHASDIYG